MSGTSRIGGYGGNFGGGGREGRSASLARFCRGRKQGDVVSGVFLRLESENLGWALLEGEELLAHLPGSGPRPEEGSQVFFRIESLAPEVVLRMVPGDAVEARLAVIAPSLPLSQEGALYVTARDKFDALLAASLPEESFPAAAADRREAFIAAVAANPALFAAFAETTARSRALLRAASGAGLRFFRHMPWLSRAVAGIEVSFWEKGESPILVGATLPGGDRLLVRGSLDEGVLRYKADIIPLAGAAKKLPPAERAFARTARTVCALDPAGTYERAETADVVGRILSLAAGAGFAAAGRFSRKL